MLSVLDGASLLAMAKKLDVTQSAVTKWLAAYVEHGFDGLSPAKPPGSQSRLSAEQLEEVAQTVEIGPEAAGFASGVWTARMIGEFIHQRFGVAYNWKYVPELLHKLGFSVQRPRKLPAYSPELNAIEGVWKVTRRTTTHNRYFDTPEQRDTALVETFVGFQRNPGLLEAQVLRFRA